MQNLGCPSWQKDVLCRDFHYLSRHTRFWHSQTITQGLTTLSQGLKTHMNNPGPSKNALILLLLLQKSVYSMLRNCNLSGIKLSSITSEFSNEFFQLVCLSYCKFVNFREVLYFRETSYNLLCLFAYKQ